MYFGHLFSNLVAPIGAIWPPFSCLFVPFAPLWFTFGYLLAPFGSFLAPFRVPSRYFGPELRATSYLDGFFSRKKERETEQMRDVKIRDGQNAGRIQIAHSIVNSIAGPVPLRKGFKYAKHACVLNTDDVLLHSTHV